jgi:cell fate regulator YaaT (PSP1 superfamily)
VSLAPDLPSESPDEDGEPLHELPDDHEWPSGQLMNVVTIKFHPAGKLYEMDAGDGSFAPGDPIIVETDRGVQQGIVALRPERRLAREPLRRVLRRADARDLQAAERNLRRAAECLTFARERVHERRMPIKMFKVELLPGGSKALFYFSSEDRIDFRDLVRDLTNRFHLRVEMRQTGVRDEAKLVGGIGSCGRELCCSTFLPRFEPVSIKMAKDQGLVLNPSKVSGQCGRLKCCLVYEEATYREMRKGLPKVGKRVTTPAGEGRVAEVDVLRQRIRVAFEPGEFQTFPADTVSAIAPIGPPGASAPPVVPPDDDEAGE